MKRVLAALVVGVAAIAIAAPAQAMTPRSGGWDPRTPPSAPELVALERTLTDAVYAITCGGLTATGWSADAFDDTVGDWDTALVTTSAMGEACWFSTVAPSVRQGAAAFVARAWLFAAPGGLVTLSGDRPYIDWDFVPTPRVNQWVALQARAADGSVLPLLQRRIVSVNADTFVIDQAVGADYLGAPVIDNRGRALGMLTAAGTLVTGSPQYCDRLFYCTDPARVWWDITAPSAVTAAKAVGAKRSVVVTWKPVASDGGDPVTYFYSVNGGPWTEPKGFRVVIPAKPRQSVTVTIQAVNQAGYGPSTTVAARAK